MTISNLSIISSATNKEPLTIKVDSIAPGITEYTETIGGKVKTYSFIDSYLTGGSQISLYCMVSDNINGLLQTGNYSGINSSYKKITLGGSELSNSTITFDDTVADKVIVTISESDLAGKEGFFPVAIELKDIAGNVVSKTIGTLNVDRTPPKVELNALTDADTDSNGNPMAVTYDAYDMIEARSALMEFEDGASTIFEGEEIVVSGTAGNNYVRYTILFWLEGDDPDCNEDILGKSARFELEADVVS